MNPLKQYFGDSVYADYDGHSLILTTENGDGPNNTILIESAVYLALVKYVERLKELNAKKAEETQ